MFSDATIFYHRRGESDCMQSISKNSKRILPRPFAFEKDFESTQ